MQHPALWPCPGCGRQVALPGREPLADGALPDADLSRLAQALCGCYVLSMAPSSLGRLLAAVLAADPDPPSGPVPEL